MTNIELARLLRNVREGFGPPNGPEDCQQLCLCASGPERRKQMIAAMKAALTAEQQTAFLEALRTRRGKQKAASDLSDWDANATCVAFQDWLGALLDILKPPEELKCIVRELLLPWKALDHD